MVRKGRRKLHQKLREKSEADGLGQDGYDGDGYWDVEQQEVATEQEQEEEND